MNKNQRNETYIGLMSGTSADGIDVAIVEFKFSDRHPDKLCYRDICPLFFKTYPYPKKIKKELLNIFKDPKKHKSRIIKLDNVLGKLFGQAVNRALKSSKINKNTIKAIGSHGQTVWHKPYGKNPFSLQIGNPKIINKLTSLPVIYNFREKDIKAGGQGAPLTPFLDWFLFKKQKKNIILVNLGGISNITFIPKDGSIKKVIGFDTGPANMLIDIAMRYYFKKDYDKNGLIASKGKINENILKKLLSHPYFKKKPPKSTGHEDFGPSYFKKIKSLFRKLKKEDIIATLTAFTSYSIFYQLPHIDNHIVAAGFSLRKPHGASQIIFTGGGAKNKTMIKIFNNLLWGHEIKTFDQLKLPFSSDAKEAVLIALLAYCYTKNIPSNIPSVTGAKKPIVLGEKLN